MRWKSRNIYWSLTIYQLLLPVCSVMSDSAMPWSVAHQALLSMRFPRQENWGGCYFFLWGIFSTLGWKLYLLYLLHCRWILYRWVMGEAHISTPMCLLHNKWLGEFTECNTKFSIHIKEDGIDYCFFLQMGNLKFRKFKLHSFFFCCSGFCHTLKWISHGFTCVPHPDPPSHLPLHPLPLGLPSAPGPSACLMQPTWAGDLFHPR